MGGGSILDGNEKSSNNDRVLMLVAGIIVNNRSVQHALARRGRYGSSTWRTSELTSPQIWRRLFLESGRLLQGLVAVDLWDNALLQAFPQPRMGNPGRFW